MPETELILLFIAVFLLILILLQTARILTRLKRFEGRMPKPVSSRKHTKDKVVLHQKGSGGLFDSFLEEDPSRRTLSKSEQFAAYRRWRKDKGLSWSRP
jgi:hypothetical protein